MRIAPPDRSHNESSFARSFLRRTLAGRLLRYVIEPGSLVPIIRYLSGNFQDVTAKRSDIILGFEERGSRTRTNFDKFSLHVTLLGDSTLLVRVLSFVYTNAKYRYKRTFLCLTRVRARAITCLLSTLREGIHTYVCTYLHTYLTEKSAHLRNLTSRSLLRAFLLTFA